MRREEKRKEIDALWDLASNYELGDDGTEIDLDKAFGLFMQCAEYYAEDPDCEGAQMALESVGDFYYEGLGCVKQDYAEAAIWYEMASKTPNFSEQDRFGEMFEKGLGVEVDYRRAIELYCSAGDVYELQDGLERSINLCRKLDDPVLLDRLELKLALVERSERWWRENPVYPINAAAPDYKDEPFTMESFRRYYNGEFLKDLNTYYDIAPGSAKVPYNFIGFMSAPREGYGQAQWNRKRPSMKWRGRTHVDMFAVGVFFMVLCEQCIGRLYGRENMIRFLRTSGWPMFSCGLGGVMHPIQTICESGLFYLGYDQRGFASYIERVRIAGDYLTDDFCDFFRDGVANLDDVAHRELVGRVDVDRLRSLIAEQVALYIAWIKDPRTAFESNWAGEI